MSALRLGRPGYPTVIIDQGPACGRVSHTRGPVAPLGGMLVVAHGPKPAERSIGSGTVTSPTSEAKRRYERAYYATHKEAYLERQRRYRARKAER